MNARILLVDGEPSTQEAIGRLLRREPYEIFSADDAPEGFRLLERISVDLIIANHSLPSMSGEELLHRACAHEDDVSGLLIKDGHEPDIEHVAPSFPTVCRPWNDAELKLLVKHLMQTGKLERENALLRAQLRVQQAHTSSLQEILLYLGHHRTGH
ncbi:MAG: response regulator [Planctomycetes bacterium]|nr:response regulator [Planctomycetota bacterium]